VKDLVEFLRRRKMKSGGLGFCAASKKEEILAPSLNTYAQQIITAKIDFKKKYILRKLFCVICGFSSHILIIQLNFFI